MSSQVLTPRAKQMAEVATATTIVAGCPVAVVWWLRLDGGCHLGAGLAIGLGMAISLLLSYIGRIIWETRPGSEDLLFSELMVWGYLHRLRSQRRLANVTGLLAPVGDDAARPASKEQKRNVKLLEQLVSGMETHDPYLHGHSRRVARHSWMIARQMALPREEVARIRTAAAIHDVGKINTPKSILHKPDRLTDAEYEVIKRHPGEGADMVEVLGDPVITSIVRHHHERVDGSGYPHEPLGGGHPARVRGSSPWRTPSTRSPRRGPTVRPALTRRRSTSSGRRPGRAWTRMWSGPSAPTTPVEGRWRSGRSSPACRSAW